MGNGTAVSKRAHATCRSLERPRRDLLRYSTRMAIQRTADMWVEYVQLRIRSDTPLSHLYHQLQQSRRASCRLGMTNIRLAAPECEHSSIGTSRR